MFLLKHETYAVKSTSYTALAYDELSPSFYKELP